MNKTTVVFHSADYDGIFCREIARKFLPDAELIGWDFADKPLAIPDGQIYVLDLPVDRVFGGAFGTGKPKDALPSELLDRVIWIDHHKSSIESHPGLLMGYRIDGVAACRLAWQYFNQKSPNPFLPTDVQFKNREVSEPLAVRLAGEYDIWDHRGDGDLEFQFGLDAQGGILDWDALLSVSPFPSNYFNHVLNSGGAAMKCYAKRDADIMRERSFATEFEGLKFLCLNTARCNSNTFAAKDIPSTGHDALMAFYFNGEAWNVSLYHAAHRKDIDLSLIAVKFGGGGHRGACGFRTDKPPFLK